ncbi:MAG: phage portal protein [Proteobacteria bacterium]|nr:phage portal protein [Pseudomonadota bacterium]
MSLISEALTRWLPVQRRVPSGQLAERTSRATSSALGGRLPAGESPGANERLFPSLNQKGTATGPLIAYQNLGEPVWAPRDYSAFAREGFMQNAIVYRSVRMIAEAAATIPLLLYEGVNEIEDHPLIDLIRRPSLDHTGTDFLEAWYGFLLVAGNAYVEAVALDGEIRELHILRPDRMKVIPGLDGWPEGYEYTVAGRSVRFIDEVATGVRPILHVRLFHPANDHYGMSPIEAAATAIDIHNTASGWNKALLDNSARPSGALVYAASNGQMTDEQFTRLKAELETNFQGARAAGRPLLLEGGLDWKPLSLTPKDMDFIEAKNAAAREIALAIGVPPMLLGIPGDNTYSNYQEAQRAFWRQTVLPLVNRTARALASWLAPAFNTGPVPRGRLPGGESRGTNLELKPDLDQIEALAPERDALWKRLEAASFLTNDEKRAAAGYDAKPDSSPSLKYREDQPRVPAGQTGGGQWTDGGGGTASTSDGRVRVAQADPLAGYPIDLREEEKLGGHAITEHVGANPKYLVERVQNEATKTVERGDDFRGLGVGSFTSMQAATKLVNSVVSNNPEKVEQVVSGGSPIEVLSTWFSQPTGYEAYLPRYNAQPYMRDTYGVQVVILRDKRAAKGFRVQTAYPVK